jgi:hypothetical protein
MLWKIGALACVVVALSAAPAAATYNPKPPGVQGPPTAVSGQQITLTGQGCPPGRAVHYYFRGVPRQYSPPPAPPSHHHHHHGHHHHGHHHHGHHHHKGHHHKRGTTAKHVSVKHSNRHNDPPQHGPYGQVVLGNERGTADGNFTLTTAIPRNLGGGLYVVVVKCGNVRVTTNIRVTPAGSSGPATAHLVSWHGGLRPGAPHDRVAASSRVVGASLLAGGGLVVLSRGRRQRRRLPSS